VSAGRAQIGNEFGHRTDARHAADRHWAFTQASAVFGKIEKLDRHAANLAVPVKRNNSGMFLKAHPIRSGVLTLFAAKPAPASLAVACRFSKN
jgi:hypothetical protein